MFEKIFHNAKLFSVIISFIYYLLSLVPDLVPGSQCETSLTTFHYNN